MRRGFGLIGALVTVIVLVIVGAIAYNIGWSEGVNTHLPAATQGDGAPYNYYGYGAYSYGLSNRRSNGLMFWRRKKDAASKSEAATG